MTKTVEERERVVVRFAGDSGDGMQLAGSRFTDATAMLGNDLATLPNFPAEIRAPAGTLAGVSAFQIHFASRDILTPGDKPNVLVAMNPAALMANLAELDRGATLIVNEDAFTKRNLEKAGYTANPLEDGSLSAYRVHRIPMTSLTVAAVEQIEDASTRDAGRAKNLFALGVISWLYGRPDRGHQALDRAEVRQAAAGAPGEPGRLQRRLVVRRDDRTARRPIQGQARDRRAARDLPERERHHRAVTRADRGERAQRSADAARELSDHAGLRAPARALAPRRPRRRRRSRPRTRSRPRAWRSARRSAGGWA